MSKTKTTTHLTDVATVGIPVADQDRAIDFYVGTLGFEKRLDGAFGLGDRWVEVAPAGATTSIALVRATAASPTGIDTQVRLTTTDAAVDREVLAAHGVDVDAEVIPQPVPMFTFRDPDGNRLYVVERPDVTV
jgi:catechol 2,3-dioxygenase-like lactoylglutathione lyase family enzyme